MEPYWPHYFKEPYSQPPLCNSRPDSTKPIVLTQFTDLFLCIKDHLFKSVFLFLYCIDFFSQLTICAWFLPLFNSGTSFKNYSMDYSYWVFICTGHWALPTTLQLFLFPFYRVRNKSKLATFTLREEVWTIKWQK